MVIVFNGLRRDGRGIQTLALIKLEEECGILLTG